jgi:hypothetical protein
VSAEPIPPAPVNRCPDCREKGVVLLGYEVGAPVAVVEGARPTGTLLLVRYGQRWGVRELAAGERPVSSELQRGRHVCLPHRYRCMAPACVFRARLFPGGTFCEDHRP